MDKNPFERSTNFQVSEEQINQEAKDTAIRGAIIRAVVSVTILALVIVTLIFSVRYLPAIFESITSFFNRFRSDKITLTVNPQPASSGELMTVTPKHTAKVATASTTASFYSFAYDCVPEFQFFAPQSATSTVALPCATPLYTASTTPIQLIPVIQGTSTKVSVPFSYAHILAGTTTPQTVKQINITVTKKESPIPAATSSAPTYTTPSMGTPTTTSSPQNTTPVQLSKSDLEVTIFTRGIIDTATGVFIPRSTIFPGERAAIRFQVMNTGGVATGPWNFVAQLPSSDTPVYTSTNQNSLTPGYSATYTLSFIYNPQVYTNQITLTVSGQNERTQSNNTVWLKL